MKAQDLKFTQLIQGPKQFIIPIFQRTYSWERSHCEQLWNDIMRVGASDLNSHFIGSAVYIPEQEINAAITRWLVIDGQQRITTITLLLIAFMRRLKEDNLDTPISAAEMEEYYLVNRYGKEDQRYKMLLTKTDKDTLISLVDDKSPPERVSQRILENFNFFTEKIADANLDIVYKGIQKLMIVDVSLQQGIDNPQMIFESMNSTGRALTQADLIRNFVLMGLPHDQQTSLYDTYWRPMEVLFGAESYNSHFDEFMRYFLVIHTGNYRIKKDDVYAEFKIHSRNFKATEELLKMLLEFADYYCCIALAKEKDQELAPAFKDILELRADVCYPLLMDVYQDYSLGQISKKEFIEIILLVESYVFRRAVCDFPTNSLRQTFATFNKSIKKDRYIESVKAAFLLLRSYRCFPNDDEFKRNLKGKNLYAFNRRSYWLRRFENFGRKERVQVQDYTIEHIMPQNEELRPEWKQALGDTWKSIHEQYLHTLGNLTLTGYNSEYSDLPFAQKRDMEGGFRFSPLKLNEGLGECENWNESTIKDRADKMADKAVDIWAAPILEEDILEVYRTEGKDNGTEYSIKDHPNLSSGPTLELFEAFRQAVLALDECVREEFRKLYVAYKAETNFVDVVPQAKRLKLSLNLDFAEIDDPRNICKDVSNLGRWGNGNVEVGLESQEDLPYVIGLVRQALERQLGEENVEL